jgi:hypothetical protein
MTPPIGLLMAAAAVAIGTGLGWALLYAVMPWTRSGSWPARSRAQWLAQLRLLPLVSAVALTAAQVQAFVRFEPARVESAGPLLIGLAAAGALLGADAAWRAWRCWSGTRRLAAAWRGHAEPLVLTSWTSPAWVIQPAFPVVAVVGAWRPHLFVARQVLDRCTPAELAAIAAHESAHVRAGDNLIRLLFALTPGARLATAVSRRLEDEWLAASEESADQRASARTSPLDLASALTKVARLAPVMISPVSASALINVSDVNTRVRRLLAGAPSPATARTVWFPALMALTVAVTLQLPLVGVRLHELFEWLVRTR